MEKIQIFFFDSFSDIGRHYAKVFNKKRYSVFPFIAMTLLDRF